MVKKKNISKVKRQMANRENIFSTYITGREHILKNSCKSIEKQEYI